MSEPVTTIVIPTRERPAKLEACLEGISRLDHDHERFEVVVVDDGSTRSLASVVDQFRGRLSIQVIVRPRGGPAAARNAGTHVARGRFLAFIDDDCTPASDWLTTVERELTRHPDRLVGGRVVNALPDNVYSTASQLITTYVSEYYHDRPERERFFTTNNFALSAARFRQMGGFDTSIRSWTAEDKEFCDRWRASGFLLSWLPDATAYHAHDLTLGGFVRQHYDYGRGIFTFRAMRSRRRSTPLVPEPLGFYRDLILAPTRGGTGLGRWRYAMLLLVSQGATVAGALKASIWERPRDGSPSATAARETPTGT